MNSLLVKHRPKDCDPAAFGVAWHNSGYVLEALYKTIQQLQQENNKINKDDFDCPNHYAKLAYQAGMNKAYETILEMMPESAK